MKRGPYRPSLILSQMLYAATRTTLTKSLGAAHFTDSIFATSKDELSADAYAKHKRHLAAPKPMSAREKEIEAVKAAERQAGGHSYEGSNTRRNHIASGVGFQWAHDADNAVRELASGSGISLVVLVGLVHSPPLESLTDLRTEHRSVDRDCRTFVYQRLHCRTVRFLITCFRAL